MGVRLYDSRTGLFLSTDPVPDGSANSYEYGNGDPFDQYDLDGRISKKAKKKAKKKAIEARACTSLGYRNRVVASTISTISVMALGMRGQLLAASTPSVTGSTGGITSSDDK